MYIKVYVDDIILADRIEEQLQGIYQRMTWKNA